jgi:hypothetical protein
MHLCTDCHINLQHQKGWMALIEKWPHITFRVAEAFLNAGHIRPVMNDPAWKPVADKIKELQKYREEEHEQDVEHVQQHFGGQRTDIGLF